MFSQSRVCRILCSALNEALIVAVFFIVFRETIETAIIVSLLLSLIRTSLKDDDPITYKKLRKQVSLRESNGSAVTNGPEGLARPGPGLPRRPHYWLRHDRRILWVEKC